MKIAGVPALLVVCLTSMLFTTTALFSAPNQPAEYNLPDICRAKFSGSYITTITDAAGQQVVSRNILTLSADGNMMSIDSNQGGVEGMFNPFGDSAGSYTCAGEQDIRAVVLNFIFAGPYGERGIVRRDIRINLGSVTPKIGGTIQIRTFALDANPMQGEGQYYGSYAFTGQRIETD